VNVLANECGFFNLEPVSGELRDQQESVGSCGIDEGKWRLTLGLASSRIGNVARL
jgi:hypothetical protein